MKSDPNELLTQVLAWIFLGGYFVLFIWGVRVARAGGPDNELYSYFGTGFATLVAGVVAAALGQRSRESGRSILILAYVIMYFATGVAAIVTWINCVNATPVLIRAIATGSFGLAVAVVGAYLKPQALFGH
jgi:hypothetical protein